MMMDAKFRGTCRECGTDIEINDPIKWKKGSGAKHVVCPRKELKSEVILDKDVVWKDINQYSYLQLLKIEFCQRCGNTLKSKTDTYIDDDRKTCGGCFGK